MELRLAWQMLSTEHYQFPGSSNSLLLTVSPSINVFRIFGQTAISGKWQTP